MKKIVLLSYLNRSGSTFFVNQLSKIPEICVCPEADILYDILLSNSNIHIKSQHIKKWKLVFESDTKFQSWKLPVETIINENSIGRNSYSLFIDILIAFQKRHFPDCTTIVFKYNYLYKIFNKLPMLSGIDLYGISLIRDPRAIYISQKNTITPQTGKVMCNNPLILIREWNSFIKDHSEIFPVSANYLIVEYEKLIKYFQTTMENVLNFLKINELFSQYDKGKGMVFKWLHDDYRYLHPHIEKPPNQNHINKWSEDISNIDIALLQKCAYKTNYYELPDEKTINSLKFTYYQISYNIKKVKYLFSQFLRRYVFKIRYLFRIF